MVDFAGWEMPLLYSGIVEEHVHTRRAASVFDVSHMGRLGIHGTGATDLLQRVCTRQLGDMAVGQSRYSLVCHEDGGVLDDVIVSRYGNHWLMVCNASNREKIVAWLGRHAGDGVEVRDETEATLMVAIQGPEAVGWLSGKLPVPVAALKRYRFIAGDLMMIPYAVFRSGYTGEDGVELIVPAGVAAMLSGVLGDFGSASSVIRPAGLGARDTLRMEAGMPLYGHELHEEIDPLSAGLDWCVDLEKDFIGAEPLRAIAKRGPARRLVGLELDGKRIARQGAAIHDGDRPVGEVTSGTSSPTLGKSIAMGYLEAALAEPGRSLTVATGRGRSAATVTALPFYRRGRA